MIEKIIGNLVTNSWELTSHNQTEFGLMQICRVGKNKKILKPPKRFKEHK
jgi:hypothetical protein